MKFMKDMKAGSVREPGVGMAEKNATRASVSPSDSARLTFARVAFLSAAAFGRPRA